MACKCYRYLVARVLDWVKLREDFPVIKKYTYLANAAIAPIPIQVYNEVSKFYKDILNHGQTLWDEWEIKTNRQGLYTPNLSELITDWSGFRSLGGNIISDPAVTSNSDGRLEVFVIQSDSKVIDLDKKILNRRIYSRNCFDWRSWHYP